MGFRSKLLSLITVDDPVSLVASWFMDKSDRQRIDAQLLACQELIVYSSRGQFTTQVVFTGSNPGNTGDVVCVAPTVANESDPLNASRYVTLATSSPISTAGLVFGILVGPAAVNGLARVAVEGIVGPTITGLASGSSGPVRVAAGRCQRVASLASGDYPVGYVDSLGNLTLARGLKIP